MQNINVEKNGYIYVYVSNESPTDVFFDNLQVIHTRGPILEETHYYPFGLTMAGISSRALKPNLAENKYKFNGIEFNNDLDINQYDAFYRNYNPQIGRWFQVDPKPTDFESPYAAMGNNPNLRNDFLGDTSIFYNAAGAQIHRVDDGSKKNSYTIIPEDRQEGFDLIVGAGDGVKAYYTDVDGNFDAAAYAAGLRGVGTTYDVEAFSKFYDENGKAISAKSVDGVPTEGMTHIKLNGKSGKLYAEVQGNLIMRDGTVTVGKEKQSKGDMTHANPSDLSDEPGKVAHIHTHPIAVKTTLEYMRGPIPGGGTFSPGPSTEDRTVAGQNKKGIRNVVVDSRNIYLINGWINQTITIHRK